LYQEESDLGCLVKQLKEEPDLLSKLIIEIPKINGGTAAQPSIKELVAYKDKMRISDQDWAETVKTFGLGPYVRISAIRKQRMKDNEMTTIWPVGGSGYEILLLPYLQQLLKQNPPSDPTLPVTVKFAFDGATMTSGKRVQQELGGVQLLTAGEPLASVKSPKNCHINVIYIGRETDKELHELLANMSEVCKYFVEAVDVSRLCADHMSEGG
jgi:hypothetical protein